MIMTTPDGREYTWREAYIRDTRGQEVCNCLDRTGLTLVADTEQEARQVLRGAWRARTIRAICQYLDGRERQTEAARLQRLNDTDLLSAAGDFDHQQRATAEMMDSLEDTANREREAAQRGR